MTQRDLRVDDEFDAMLDEMTHGVASAWDRDRGVRLETMDLYRLNDVLTAFFGPRRPR